MWTFVGGLLLVQLGIVALQPVKDMRERVVLILSIMTGIVACLTH